ncbi:MAG: type II/IV secretion system protein [Moraxellaceae bacterium]|nr:type II/IV secretion system protein [Moraxellaceae bacterium]MBP9731508.1 type II/IV secretion system protein [Moraxellaceae bacterium]MCC6200308.1 type II/IV secretion system protein [Moraxellaceae bacterium]HQV42209.1 GspE/PulE family protein [Moraxellaceae bacterium]
MNKPVENPAEKPVQKLVGKTPFSFRIDLRWCLDELLKDGRLSQRDANQASTTPRTRDQLNWHPLQVVAHFDFEDARSNGSSKLSADVLVAWLAERAEQPVFHIDPIKIRAADITGVMSYAFAERHGILAVQTSPDEVVIASAQPFHTEWMENLQQSLRGRQIRRVVADPADIHRYTIEFYRLVRAIEGANASDSVSQQYVSNFEQLLELGNIGSPDANDQHVVNIVDWLLQYAFDQRASDIHLEPRREIGRVRFRIDGVLHNIYEFPHLIMNAVVSRIKILGRMNVAEKRKPQDGRLKTRNPKGQETELRLSTLPTAFGEKLVMRIFDPDVLVRSFKQLGLQGEDFEKWEVMVKEPNGIILVTGPTGSGKTTTLYSTLRTLATDEVNVCTIEDPIEMIEGSFNQMQVQHNIELDFAEGIRALMRQDPDIIMVGEVRDPETADMAIQAALTGHLVLSTLHTNDAPSSITRLADLGVQPFLIAATVLGVMAQRLVRTLCPHCKVEVDCDEKAWADLTHPWKAPVPKKICQPKGCLECRETGYLGRMGIYEIMVLSHELKKVISEGASLVDIRKQAYKEGLRPLRISGAQKVAHGQTTIEEVLRVAPLN